MKNAKAPEGFILHRYTAVAISALVLAAAGPALATTQEEADAALSGGDYRTAAVAYRALLDEDGKNAQNWYNLGVALNQIEDYGEARKALKKALGAGYQPAARARIALARAAMAMGREKEALAELEIVAASGGPSGAFLRSLPEFAPLAENPRFIAVVKALTPCAEGHYRDFDFWRGEWDVTPPGATAPTASSRISMREEGCVILEEYKAGGGFTGMSINFYDAAMEKWRQTWMSSSGGSVYLEGGLTADGAMQMSDADLPISKLSGSVNRVTWTPNDDGSVRQFWQSSSDEGKTWTVSFDGRYTRKPQDADQQDQ